MLHVERARFLPPSDPPSAGGIPHADVAENLSAVRRHLNLDVAFVSRLAGDERIALQTGDGARAAADDVGEETGGSGNAAAQALSGAHGRSVGCDLSVPLVLSDGSLYGTFCCFAQAAGRTPADRDLDILRVVAELTVRHIESDEANRRLLGSKTERIRAMVAAGGPDIVFQPVMLLEDGRIAGVEALSRFGGEPPRAPDAWFAEAAAIGMGVALERLAMGNAIRLWRPLWQRHRFQLGLNCSSRTVIDGHLGDLFDDDFADRIVLELTEHDIVEDYGELERALVPLRARGVKLAIDDVGAGYASLRHILFTRPDILKLDISLTHDIDTDLMRRSLAAAIVRFADGFGARVVAEGVEREGELEMLRGLGVHAAQGYHIARPLGLPEFQRFLASR